MCVCVYTVDEVWVVAALAQLHHGVEEVGDTRCSSSSSTLRQEGEVLLQDSSVVFLLDVGELHLDDGLLFRCQVLLHVLLQSPQHHRFEDSLQLLNLGGVKKEREVYYSHRVFLKELY